MLLQKSPEASKIVREITSLRAHDDWKLLNQQGPLWLDPCTLFTEFGAFWPIFKWPLKRIVSCGTVREARRVTIDCATGNNEVWDSHSRRFM